MSETLIFNYKDPRAQLLDLRAQVDDIFFEASTKKDFKDPPEKEAFNWKYLGFYLSHYPEYAWIAAQGDKVLGYLVGMPFSHDPSLYQIQPHLQAFTSFFKQYPAHLHINCHLEARGKGIGKSLTEQLFNQLRAEHSPGIHIMTGLTSANRLFYSKLGFDVEEVQGSILAMGKSLFRSK